MLPLLGLLTPVLEIGNTIIERLIPDPTEKAKAQLALMQLAQEGQLKELTAAMEVVVAEAKSEHFIVAAWRPILALVLTFIVLNNFVIFPYLQLLFNTGVMLDLNPEIWALLRLCLGGYIASRGIEKVAETWKGK